MKRLVNAFVALLLVAGCATLSLNQSMKAAFDTLTTYTQQTRLLAQEGLLSKEETAQRLTLIEKAYGTLEVARVFAASCEKGAKADCTAAEDKLAVTNQLLFELQKQMLAKEKK